jgi:hypothetical protein
MEPVDTQESDPYGLEGSVDVAHTPEFRQETVRL